MASRPELAIEALRDAAGRGPEHALAGACACWARRCGLRLPKRWAPDEVSAGVRGAIDGLDESLLSDPARVLGSALERLLEDGGGRAHRRKRSGAYYTPEPLVQHVLSTALDPGLASVSPERGVFDPACGSGVFLVASVRRLRGRPDAAACVSGIDINPAAVLLARFSVWLESGGRADPAMLERRIRVGDALLEDAGGEFDVVVGNPPFLNQLETATAHGRARATALRERYGDSARCYADAAAVFLEMALRSVRPGGRSALVQPQSLLASRDAEPVRRSVLARGELTDLWVAREHMFGASVLVCVPTVRVGGTGGSPRVRAGSDFALVPGPAREAAPGSWAPLVAGAHGIPEIDLAGGRTLGDYASATADFRDQFYGLRGCIIESPPVGGGPEREAPRLITTGLVDPAHCRWGEVPTRIAGERWLAPRVDLARLAEDPEMARWARARLVPKVLLATQTRVLEAAVDEGGDWLPVTPLITVTPRDPGMLWMIGAALCSPVLSAIALREYAGAGLSASAIKLSARQAMRLPAPADDAAWRRAGALFRDASGAGPGRRRGLLVESARAMCAAYRVDDGALLAWWSERLPARSAPVGLSGAG